MKSGNPTNRDDSRRRAPSARLAFLALAALAVSALLVASCYNEFGVFKDIQLEPVQDAANIFKGAGVVTAGSDGINLYAMMAKVYRRTVAGDTWEVLQVNGTADYRAAGLAADPATAVHKVWVASVDGPTDTFHGVYVSSDGGGAWSSVDFDDALGPSDRVQNLMLVNSRLFMGVQQVGTTTTYGLKSLDTTSPTAKFADVTVPSGLDASIRAGAWNGSEYVFISGTRVLKGTASALTEDAAAQAASAGKALGGIAAAGTDTYVSTSAGKLLKLSAGAWTALDNDGATIAYGAVGSFTPAPAGGTAVLAMGKGDSTFGYDEFNLSDGTWQAGEDGTLVPNSASYSSSLRGKPVNAFVYLPTVGTTGMAMAACASYGTSGSGLYTNVWNASSSKWEGWTAE